MKSEKAVGPDLICVKIWKCLCEEGLDWLMELFNFNFRTVKMPNEQKTSTVIPLYNDESDIQDCNNY